MSKEDEYIGEQIRKYRAMNHISQEELGKELGLTKQIVSKIEKGERKISYRELAKIADYLEESIDTFTVIDLKFKLISRKHHSIDIPKFAIDFLDDFETFLRQGTNSDVSDLIREEISHEMLEIYHKVYRTSWKA
jgi:transcriptional regulator with XRE-family HTH domain